MFSSWCVRMIMLALVSPGSCQKASNISCVDISGSYTILSSLFIVYDDPDEARIYVKQQGCQAFLTLGHHCYRDDDMCDIQYKVKGNTIQLPSSRVVGVVQGSGTPISGDIAFNGSNSYFEGYWEKQTCVDFPGWKDFWGNDCAYYGFSKSRCGAGGLPGVTLARVACCACNGGNLTTVTTTTVPHNLVCFAPVPCTTYGCGAKAGSSYKSISDGFTRRNQSVYCDGVFEKCTSDYGSNPGAREWSPRKTELCCRAPYLDDYSALHRRVDYASPSDQACYDVWVNESRMPWHDSRGKEYDCVWYSIGDRCSQYGSEYEAFGYNAQEACCTCGGTEACYDHKVLKGQSFWRSGEFYDSHCPRYPHDHYAERMCLSGQETFGMNASVACCMCGGGRKKPKEECEDVPGYTSPSGYACSSYNEYSVDSNGKCRPRGVGDNVCRFTGNCPDKGCCTCGGGTWKPIRLTTTTSTTTTGSCISPVACSAYGCPPGFITSSKSIYCRAPTMPDCSDLGCDPDKDDPHHQIPLCSISFCNNSKFCWDSYGNGGGCCVKDAGQMCFEGSATCGSFTCPSGYRRKASDDFKLPCKERDSDDSPLRKCGSSDWSGRVAGHLEYCCEPNVVTEIKGGFEMYSTGYGCQPGSATHFMGPVPSQSLQDCAWECAKAPYCKYFSFGIETVVTVGEHQRGLCFMTEDCSNKYSANRNTYMKTTTTTTTQAKYCDAGTKCSAFQCPEGHILQNPDRWVPCSEYATNGYKFNRCPTDYGNRVDRRWRDGYHTDEYDKTIFNTCCALDTTEIAMQEVKEVFAFMATMPRAFVFTASVFVSGAAVLMVKLFVKSRQSVAHLNMQTPFLGS